MKIINNPTPLGIDKNNTDILDNLNLKCYAVLSNNCSEYLFKFFNYLSNDFNSILYVEIQGDDNRLKLFLNKNDSIKQYKLTPMEPNGFFKFKLGILQFYSNNHNVFKNISDLWDSDLFFRIMLLRDSDDYDLKLSCADNYELLLKKANVVITQSGDGDEIEIIERNDRPSLIDAVLHEK